MKNKKITKLFLSLLVLLTISCTNGKLLQNPIHFNYDSQIQLCREEPEDSFFGEPERQ